MAPKPYEYKDDPRAPPSPTINRLESGKRPLQAVQSESTSTPLSLVVLGIFGQGGDWDDEKEEYKTPPMTRYRLNTTDPDGDNYESALFVPTEGLTVGGDAHEFYHNDLSDDEDEDDKIGDRAILFQSIENYEKASTKESLAEYFHLADKEAMEEGNPLTLTDRELLKGRALKDPRFGEQVIVEGATPADISLGDIFEIAGGKSPLKVQVTSPRKPCYELDKKNKTPMGARGIKQYAATTGLAGWFTSVLVQGERKDGMRLVRTQHPYPKWTMENLCQALYGGEGDPKALLRGKASWGRSRGELQELMDIDILCGEEWRDELKPLMEKLIAEEKEKGYFSSELECSTATAFFDSITDSFNSVFSSLCNLSMLGCFDFDEDHLACKWPV